LIYWWWILKYGGKKNIPLLDLIGKAGYLEDEVKNLKRKLD
jgi:hypothetical protein